MTWSYGSDPLNNDVDAVRFLIGDTDSSDPLIQDEEIQYLLATNSVPFSAYYATRSIAAKFARLCREETGDIEVYANQKFDQYSKLAKNMSQDLQSGRPIDFTIYSGGIKHSVMDTYNKDTDRNAPPFEEGQMDYNTSRDKGSLRRHDDYC